MKRNCYSQEEQIINALKENDAAVQANLSQEKGFCQLYAIVKFLSPTEQDGCIGKTPAGLTASPCQIKILVFT